MPPRQNRPDEDNPEDNYENDNMSVDELKERLKRYVDDRDDSSRERERDEQSDL